MIEKVPELLDLTRKLLDQSVKIVNESHRPTESVPAREFNYFIYLCVQMSEALKYGYGAYCSCKNGWGYGGIGAARSIYEILLDIKYINQDEVCKDERLTRFFDHGDENLYREMEINCQLGLEGSQDVQDKLTEAYNQLKKKYADTTPRYSSFNWSGLSITQKAKVLNMTMFHQLYKMLSNLSHVGTNAMHRAISEISRDRIELNLNIHPDYTHCYDVLTVVFTCIVGILEEYIEYFKIEFSDYPVLETLSEDYKELLDMTNEHNDRNTT
jgi:hypothetical protein